MSCVSCYVCRLVVAVSLFVGLTAGCDGTETIQNSDGSEDDPTSSSEIPDATQQDDEITSPPQDSGSSADSADSSILDPLSIVGEIIRDHDLVDGDCFDRVENIIQGRKVVVTSRIECEDAHTYEVFHMFELDVPHPAIYPGNTAMREYALQRCYEHFADFVGEIYELSLYEIGVFTPDRINFEHEVARYRTVHCWLYRNDLASMTSSAKGTGV